jgi:hypothetical protein
VQLLALSDERDKSLAARLAAWREGYATGAEERFAARYAAAIADVKLTERELVAAVRLGFELWNAARATGAQLLWRTKAGHVLRPHEQLPDGSWLARVRRFSNYHMLGTDVVVRVIDYAVADPGRPQAEDRYRLLTTITDPGAAPAAELAALYPQRWEFETALDELKTHQRGPRVVLRSKMPDGVRQEIYGYLCVHYAIRWLMHTVALEAGADPDRLSFTRTLHAARRTARSHPGFSPSGAG